MDMKQWEERRAQLPGRTERKDFMVVHYYKNGKLIATITPDGSVVIPDMTVFDKAEAVLVDKEFLDFFTKAKEEIFDELAFVHARTLAQSKRQSFDSEFKAAVFKELNIDPQHSKAFKLWEKAMDSTRGQGLQALYEEVSDLSELLS